MLTPIELYRKPDGRALSDAEKAIFRSVERAHKNRMDCERYGRQGKSFYMALQNELLNVIMDVPGLWDVWEDYNATTP